MIVHIISISWGDVTWSTISFLGWCGSVPLSVIIAILLRRGPRPPQPWEILGVNIVAGILAVVATNAGFGRAPGLGEVGEFFYPVAIGVITAGLYSVVRMMAGAGARME